MKKENKIVGFLIYNTLKNNPYIWLDYFAILPEYQDKKYGTKAISLLKEYLKDYTVIFGEIEKIGMGENEKENEIRKRRVKFWKRAGFHILDTDFELFGVVYSPCILPIKEIDKEDKVVENIWLFYQEIIGKKKFEKNCKVIKNEKI